MQQLPQTAHEKKGKQLFFAGIKRVFESSNLDFFPNQHAIFAQCSFFAQLSYLEIFSALSFFTVPPPACRLTSYVHVTVNPTEGTSCCPRPNRVLRCEHRQLSRKLPCSLD